VTFNNEKDNNQQKTERLLHRDKSERLLACLEGIDDDLIAEAATAVGNGNIKRPIWQRFNLGNIAALFVGAVAISCILLLAFWLGTADGPETAEQGGTSGYADTTQATPADGLIPGGILSLPDIPASAFEAILEAGQTHMTRNNPWHDTGHVDMLPVFRNHAITQSNPPWASTLWEATDIQLSDEEWEEFIAIMHEASTSIAITAGISADRIDFAVDPMFVTTMVDGYRGFATHQLGMRSLNVHIPPVYRERIDLPPGTSLSNDAPEAEVQAAIEYLTRLLADVIPMKAPRLTNAEGLLDIGGPMTYHRQRFFDAGGSPADAILSFNFGWVEILTFDPYSPERIEIALAPHNYFEALQLGYYPIITAEEAREMLLEGYFISHYPDILWPGRESALKASVELIYHAPILSDEEVIMPFYRFLVEVDRPQWMQPGSDWALQFEADGQRAFARYYVPAVHRDFLEPMTRRQVSEPPEPPTGPRALPPEVFMHLHGMVDMWAPVRLGRHEVAELWEEILNEIGELGVNEAYQFRTACGRYAMITGSRLLTSREELHRYFPGFTWDDDTNVPYRHRPGFDLPETVGDFALREISVFDQQKDMMFIFDRPMPTFADLFTFNSSGPAPVGEIFTHDPVTFSIFAMYENSEGIQVGLGITQPIMGLHFLSEDEDPHSVLDMGEYGLIHFQGRPGEYFRAMHEAIFPIDERWFSSTLELWFINGSIDGRRLTWDLGYGPWHGSPEGFRGTHWFMPVEREVLEELVRIFNPAALAVEYNWQLMSLQ